MANVRAWNIVRRAYGKYEVVAMFKGTWMEVVDYCTEVRVINGYDGEYMERAMGERPEGYEISPMSVFYSE